MTSLSESFASFANTAALSPPDAVRLLPFFILSHVSVARRLEGPVRLGRHAACGDMGAEIIDVHLLLAELHGLDHARPGIGSAVIEALARRQPHPLRAHRDGDAVGGLERHPAEGRKRRPPIGIDSEADLAALAVDGDHPPLQEIGGAEDGIDLALSVHHRRTCSGGKARLRVAQGGILLVMQGSDFQPFAGGRAQAKAGQQADDERRVRLRG